MYSIGKSSTAYIFQGRYDSLYSSGASGPFFGLKYSSDFSLGPDDGRVHFRVFLEQSMFCYIHGHHKQYILAGTIFNYVLGGPSRNMSLFKPSKHTFLAPAESAPKRCIFQTCLKAFYWESKIENVVKYCVY